MECGGSHSAISQPNVTDNTAFITRAHCPTRTSLSISASTPTTRIPAPAAHMRTRHGAIHTAENIGALHFVLGGVEPHGCILALLHRQQMYMTCGNCTCGNAL